MPAGDSMPDTYIAIMLQSLKKKELDILASEDLDETEFVVAK